MHINRRALRRHHSARLKHKRRHDFCAYSRDERRAIGPINRHVITPCPCSCWMCGNPRKFHGNGQAAKTVAERRWLAAANDDWHHAA